MATFVLPGRAFTLVPMTRPDADDRLNSWKAIARYLGRSVRTVRRWEQQEDLPVHRLMHQAQASVFAYRQELDEWREGRALAPGKSPTMQLPSQKTPSGNAGQGEVGDGQSVTTRPTAPDNDPPVAAGIAVLPFSFAGPDPTHAWVADGLTEEIIAGFSRLSKLRVTSRTSSNALKGSERDSSAIADLLGVRYLLEGGVVGDGRQLRINVRLIDPQRDDHLWSLRFDGDMEDIFGIQDRIARAVVDALQLRLAPDEEKGIGKPTVDNLPAWRRVLLAREAAFRWRPDALEQARTLLTEALELTGENAAICATMGRVLLSYQEAGIPSDDDLVLEARSWADRAQAADPGHPETHVLNGWLAHVTGDLSLAIEELEQALQQDRDHPDALMLLAHCLLRTGQTQRARPIIDHVMAVDPLTPLARCFPGYLDAMEGRFDTAVGPYQDMLERDPANPVARLFNVWVLFGAGRDDEAIAVAAGFEGPAEDSTPAHLARLLTNAHLGTLEDLPLPKPVAEATESNEMYARHAAEAWAMAGNAERAARWLDHAVALGFVNWPYLTLHSPFLRPVINDPALEPVLARAEQRWKALGGSP